MLDALHMSWGARILNIRSAVVCSTPPAARAMGLPILASAPLPAPERTSEELMALVRDGNDDAAFSMLYERHKGGAYRVAVGILKRPAEAAEVTQEAFLKLWRFRARYNGEPFEPWCFRIAFHAAIDAYRKGKKEKAEVELDDRWLHRGYTRNQVELARIHCHTIWRWRDGLSEIERIAVKYTDGLGTNNDLAKEAGVSPGRLTQIRAEALARLKDMLEGSPS
jgi:RNA polymerase sigma factor (sigma-70 family)